MILQFAKQCRGCRIYILLLTAAGVAGAQTPQRPARPLEETAYKISPSLRAKARAGGALPVFVVLTRQPHPEIIARVHGTVEPRMRAAESEYYGLTSRGSAPADRLQAARARLSSVIVEARQESFRQIEADIRPDQDQVEAQLLSLGAIGIERYSLLNMVRADIPASALPALEADPLIASLSLVEERKPQLKDSVPYLWFGAGGGQIPAGPVDYTGRGQTVAILDTGIKTTHPAFKNLMAAGGIPARAFVGHLQNPCLAELGSTEDFQGHGTHVAGIVASEGGTEILAGFDSSEYKGVAPKVSLVNLKIAAMTQTANGCTGGSSNDDDVLSAIQWGLGLNDPRVTPITVFNYSFGACTSDGAGGCSDEDTKTSQIFDSIADYWGVTIVVAAGNDGANPAPGCGLTSRSVNDPGIAYNILSVANLNMKVVPPSPNRCPPPNPGISPKSSKGPTAATAAYPIGRRKPDIAAPGTYIYSAAFNFDVAGNPQFVTKSGTSMAAPHIAGAVAVLQNRAEVHLPPSADCFLPKTARLNTLTANTLSIKALLLNTAGFAPGASGWMADSGWGWASLSTAIKQLDLAATKGGSALAISCVQTPLQNPPPNTLPRHYRFFKGPIQATAANAFKATVVWNRHITWGPVDQLTNPVWSQSGSPNPAVPAEPSHVRLRLYDIATNNRLDADPPDNDPRNNVQQLVSTQSGTEVVKVYREAGFGPDQQEPFALAVSQPLTPASGPALGLSCGANADNNTQAVTLLCSVTNTGDLPLFNVAVQTAGGGACQFQVGAQTLPALPILNPPFPVSCSMPFPGAAPVTVNANAVFADEPFSATTVVVPPVPPPPADCQGVSLNPAHVTVGPDGGPGSFDVILPSPAKCSVRSVDVPPQLGWISVSIGADFSGGTHIQYSVFPLNPPPPPHLPPPPPNPPRSGIIEVVLRDFSTRVFNIDQNGVATPCTYTAAVAPAAFSYTGGPGAINITPNLAACTWTASAVEPYVLPAATNGQGTQVVPFTVGPNTKPDAGTLARSVTLHVTGQNSFAQTFALTQAGLACTFALSNVPQPVSADGAPGIILTVTPSSVDCQWTAQSPVNWIQIAGGATGKGVGTVTLAVAANAGDVRTATLTIAGQPFVIKQAAHCTFNLLPVADPVPAGGTPGFTVSVTASWQSCGWTAQNPVNWITILAGAAGQGNGSTMFSVAANPGVARGTALTIAGLPYPIHQDAGIQQFQLLTAVSPAGAGTVTPASGNLYRAGTVVPLAATPAAGFVFAGWTGQVAASASANTTVTMSGPQSVTAKFVSQPITVGVSPGAAFLSASQQRQFTAAVRGSANHQVTWSLSLVSGGASPLGSITKAGLYTPPSLIAAPQIVNVTATSVADPTKTGSSTVHLVPIAVTVAPATITLRAGNTHLFNATVHAGTNNQVKWSVPAGAGTVTQNGAYTAPARVNTQLVITVVATSVEDPAKSGLATITLMP